MLDWRRASGGRSSGSAGSLSTGSSLLLDGSLRRWGKDCSGAGIRCASPTLRRPCCTARHDVRSCQRKNIHQPTIPANHKRSIVSGAHRGFFYFPSRGSLGIGQKFDFGILMDFHVLRSTESKNFFFFTNCLCRLSGPMKTIIMVQFKSNLVIEV